MEALRYLAFAVVVVALIGAGTYATTMSGTVSGSSTSSSCTTSTGSSSTTATSTGGGTSATSFASSPQTPVKVLSVSASEYHGSQGTTVSFDVTYENVGTSDIYYVAGCGSSLVADVPSGSSVLQKSQTGPVCLCDEAIMHLSPGASRTAATPGCWSGYDFVLLRPGTAQVDFTLYWGPTQGAQNDTTSITAYFVFS